MAEANLKGLMEQVDRIIAEDRQDLVDMCLTMGNMISPPGHEMEVARWVEKWFKDNCIETWLQPITPASANAIGRLRGSGDGHSLILNAHTDIGRPPDPDSPERMRRIHGGWVEGDIIYGVGIVNCKAQVAASMVAARAIREAGIRLGGDLLVTAVTYETGQASVDDKQGIEWPGEGFGTMWLVNGGITADYALIGETSAWTVVAAEGGAVRFKITVPGREIHTPRLERGATLEENPNSIVRAAHLAQALEDWAVRYEQRETRAFARGTFVPKVQIKQVRSSLANTYLYLDVRLVPDANPRAVEQEIKGVIKSLGLEGDVQPYYWRRGYIARGAEPLIAAVETAHEAVIREPMGLPHPEDVTMWRDLNVFNEVGIPSICFGPPRQREHYSDAQNRCMYISDIVRNAQVYARTALQICGVAGGR